MKKVYTIYQTPQANGAYFYVADYDDSYPTAYPQTDVAIPDNLKDGLPKFNWHDNSWLDASEEGQAKLLSDLQKDNTQLKADLQVANNTAEQNKQLVSDLQGQIIALTKQLAGLQAQAQASKKEEA